MSTRVKICGIKTPDAMTAAIEGGADFVGLNFHPKSPRYVEPEVAKYLASYVPDSVKIVGLFVDARNQRIEEILGNVRIDIIQMHGFEEPDRIAGLFERYKKPVIKSFGISSAEDLKQIAEFKKAGWVLLDRPGDGGSGQTFDWNILKGWKNPKPWILAGGVNPDNVADAVKLLKPDAVDVSSGVESERGIKDPSKIRAFLEAAKA
jgi:phosphoribosylanthranilate isomerase